MWGGIMVNGYYEEGDKCTECGKGRFEYVKDGVCYCHISPPCSACTNSFLQCTECGFEPDEPDYADVPIVPNYLGVGISSREYKPKPLDNTKIDYRTTTHTASTMIKEGVYPKGTTREAVEKVVKGSFGGRFEYFAEGMFKYIAYTD